MTIQYPPELLDEARSDGAKSFEFVIVGYYDKEGCFTVNSARRCLCPTCMEVFQMCMGHLQEPTAVSGDTILH